MANEAFLQQLPEELRSDPSIQNFNDTGSLAKSYIETKKKVGEGIYLPPKEAKPEEAQEWWKGTQTKLAERGFVELPPAAPEAYEFQLEGVEDETIKSDKIINQFRQVAHKLKMPKAMANGLLGYFANEIAPMMAPEEVTEEEALAGLEKGLGKNFKEEVARARDAVKRVSVSIPEIKDDLMDTVVYADGKRLQLGNHPGFVKLFALVERLTAQDSSGAIGAGAGGGENLDSIDAQIQELRVNKDLPSEVIGQRLVTLYKKKDALLRMQK